MASDKCTNFPYSIVDLAPAMYDEFMKYFRGRLTDFVRVGPKGYFMPHKYREEVSSIYNMKLREGDTFVASFPRSGTTLTQELVWMVQHGLDYATSDAIPVTKRYTFLEYYVFFPPNLQAELWKQHAEDEHKLAILESIIGSGLVKLADANSPRFIKTHLPLSLLPPNVLDTAKVVYVARDPRDVAVSYYHLSRLSSLHEYVGDFKSFWNYFIKDMRPWMPFFEHLKESWAMRGNPNMFFLFYEDLTKDLPAAVHRVSKFFNKQFTEEQVAKLCDHLSIENFKKNKSINLDNLISMGIFKSEEQSFIRKGGVGGWRDYFDEEMEQQAERWMADNLRDTDLRFPHIDTVLYVKHK